MAEQQAPETKPADPVEMSRSMAKIAERSQRLVSEFLERQQRGEGGRELDPFNIGSAFLEMTTQMMADPAKLVQAHIGLWQDYLQLWQATTRRMLGEEAEPVIEPEPGDRRFKHADWDESHLFDFIKQSYLLTARWMQSTVREVEGLDDKTAKKVDFYTRQFADALAPSNFAMTNPEVLRATLDSGGQLPQVDSEVTPGQADRDQDQAGPLGPELRVAKADPNLPMVRRVAVHLELEQSFVAVLGHAIRTAPRPSCAA